VATSSLLPTGTQLHPNQEWEGALSGARVIQTERLTSTSGKAITTVAAWFDAVEC